MARKLTQLGHEVKLIAPQFVRPFIKTHKNDFADAQAICEAASRPSMWFVTPTTEVQQTLSVLHRARDFWVRDRVKTVNPLHTFLLEFGISLPVGKATITRLPAVLVEHLLPPRRVAIVEQLHLPFKYLGEPIRTLDKELSRQLADDHLGQRLLTIPGVSLITASVLSAEMGEGKQYGWGRNCAASIGLVPRCQYSTGGKAKVLGISKRADKTIRRLLIQCAGTYLQRFNRYTGRLAVWVRSMLTRRHPNGVACALANKLARTGWARTARRCLKRDRLLGLLDLSVLFCVFSSNSTCLVVRSLKFDDVNGTLAQRIT